MCRKRYGSSGGPSVYEKNGQRNGIYWFQNVLYQMIKENYINPTPTVDYASIYSVGSFVDLVNMYPYLFSPETIDVVEVVKAHVGGGKKGFTTVGKNLVDWYQRWGRSEDLLLKAAWMGSNYVQLFCLKTSAMEAANTRFRQLLEGKPQGLSWMTIGGVSNTGTVTDDSKTTFNYSNDFADVLMKKHGKYALQSETHHYAVVQSNLAKVGAMIMVGGTDDKRDSLAFLLHPTMAELWRATFEGLGHDVTRNVEMHILPASVATQDVSFADDLLKEVSRYYKTVMEPKDATRAFFDNNSGYAIVTLKTYNSDHSDKLLSENIAYHVCKMIVEKITGTGNHALDIRDIAVASVETNKQKNEQKVQRIKNMLSLRGRTYPGIYVEPIPISSTRLTYSSSTKGSRYGAAEKFAADELKKRQTEIDCAYGDCKPIPGMAVPTGAFINKKFDLPRPTVINPNDINCSIYTRQELDKLAKDISIDLDPEESDEALCGRIKKTAARMYRGGK